MCLGKNHKRRLLLIARRKGRSQLTGIPKVIAGWCYLVFYVPCLPPPLTLNGIMPPLNADVARLQPPPPQRYRGYTCTEVLLTSITGIILHKNRRQFATACK